MPRMVHRSRNSPQTSLVLTLAAAPFLFMGFGLALGACMLVIHVVLGWFDTLIGAPGTTYPLAGALDLWAVILFMLACVWLPVRTYQHIRWEQVPYDGSWCLKCGYNLTGNVSGICPECGEKIVMDEPSRDVAR